MLRLLVDSSERLFDAASSITYSLYMVGTGLANIEPTIVVYTRSHNVSALAASFSTRPAIDALRSGLRRNASEPAVDASYSGLHRNLLGSRILRKLQELFTDLIDARWDEQPRPPFKLVFFQYDADPVNPLGWEFKGRLPPGTTTNGMLLQYKDQAATMGLIVQVGDKMYGLTVDHLFNPRRRSGISQGISLVEAERILDMAKANSDVLDKLWEHDWEDTLNLDGENEPTPANPDMVQPPSVIQPLPSGMAPISPSRFHGMYSVSGTGISRLASISIPEPYLDWALVSIDFGRLAQRRFNTFTRPDLPDAPVSFNVVAKELRSHVSSVYIISGRSGVTTGLILRNDTYISYPRSKELCYVWTVVPDPTIGSSSTW